MHSTFPMPVHSEKQVITVHYLNKTWFVSPFSDIVVQIVDARNPLLFRCPDLVSLFQINCCCGKKNKFYFPSLFSFHISLIVFF